jgi:Phage-related terminase
VQRLHEDDLAGVLLRSSNEWTVASLPAIAEEDEEIPTGYGRIHYRRAGDVLHPEREPREVLESLRAQLGAEIFAAQYQQQPVAPGGLMIKRTWVRRYDQLPNSGQKIQSWDVANKQGEENDYSVCTTWLVHENKYYLIDVLRGRFDFPTLKTKVSEHAKLHKPSHILIEDAAVGTALIPELKALSRSSRSSRSTTRKSAWPSNPQSSRMVRCSFRRRLPGFRISKRSFSHFQTAGTHDQVDSISQALGHTIPSFWTKESLDGYNNFVTALWQDAIFARLSGRPW